MITVALIAGAMILTIAGVVLFVCGVEGVIFLIQGFDSFKRDGVATVSLLVSGCFLIWLGAVLSMQVFTA